MALVNQRAASFAMGVCLFACDGNIDADLAGTPDPNSTDAATRFDATEQSPDLHDAMPALSQADAQASTPNCSEDGIAIVALLNAYRAENSLPAIPVSPSLCVVSDAHVVDLADNSPSAPADCNLHSWSSEGSWSSCCYTSDHVQAQCMWDKPGELSSYQHTGYENAAWTSGTMTPTYAMELWKSSPGHNAVMLNEGTWASRPWNAVGAAIYDGYTVLWFGEAPDPLSNN